ncbi:Lanosterol synthase (Oxidosqualene--lanosterol cyclase) [Aspergillus hancockii]|nr:Lanosterol synthase (Oxidosqualene--lanosterol cyclase) [Aspergillus hancockii]
MFLLPCVVFAWTITETPIPWSYATEIKNYLFAHANPLGGGWGLHIEGESTVFGTSLNYTVLRLLGVDADHEVMIKARVMLHKHGGAVNAPHWAKFWLAVLGVCKWEIVNPAPPEAWLLPDWVPVAPWRWWVHIRQVFLPMSWIWSRRWTMPETEIVRALREELFVEPWESVDWAGNRNSIAEIDNHHPKTWLLGSINWVLAEVWTPYLRLGWLARRAEEWVSRLVDMEDENSDYADLASVNAPLNMVLCYIRDGPGAYSVRRHRERLEEFLWVNKEGMLVNGTNGVQCWDTAFLIQAVCAAGLAESVQWRPMLTRALEFLNQQQMRENCKDQDVCYRHPRKGAWGFSNKDQGYGVCDCISEALKSVILLQKTPGYPQLLDDRRIFDAVDTLLTYQNPSGGCSSYERTRGGEYMEMFNAAEVFGRIMVEYDYPECTTAVVTALTLFHKHWPDYRSSEIESFIQRALEYIRKAQFPDGSWYGSWAVCFTYGTMFALEIIGLLSAEYPDIKPIEKAVRLMMARQQANGEWLQEAVEGMFNKTCAISYPNYKFMFTMLALGKFATVYPDYKLN